MQRPLHRYDPLLTAVVASVVVVYALQQRYHPVVVANERAVLLLQRLTQKELKFEQVNVAH